MYDTAKKGNAIAMVHSRPSRECTSPVAVSWVLGPNLDHKRKWSETPFVFSAVRAEPAGIAKERSAHSKYLLNSLS